VGGYWNTANAWQHVPHPAPGLEREQIPSERLGYWSGSETPIQFSTTIDGAFGFTSHVSARATWVSPVFDLTPDLKASNTAPNNAVPIYSSPAPNLTLMLRRSAGSLSRLAVRTIEFGHIADPLQVTRLSSTQEITSDFYDAWDLSGGTSAMFWWGAPAHMRYWRVAFVIDRIDGDGPVPALPELLAWGVCQ